MNHTLIHNDCLDFLKTSNRRWDMVFCDPPDNINLHYPGHDDNMPEREYLDWLGDCLLAFLLAAPIVWMSYNAKWTFQMGAIIKFLESRPLWFPGLEVKPYVQTYTFYQHNKSDLGVAHRPLVRLRRDSAPIYSDQIRVPSWRQLNGDKRANPKGKVPGTVFDFPRVTGNSHQKRRWCPTQLHEGLIERCIKLSTLRGGTVLDPFAGTGTTLRVCKRINRQCTLIERSLSFCREIADEHDLDIEM